MGPAVTALNAVAAPLAAHAIAAPALGYAGLGYAGLGYAGLGYGHYYGKREAEAEPKADAYSATDTVSDTATPVSDTDTLVSATATVLEPTELDTDTTTVKLVQLNSRSSTQSLPSVLLSWE